MSTPAPQNRPTTQIGEDLFGAWECNLDAHQAAIAEKPAEVLEHVLATEKRISAALVVLLDLKRKLQAEL